MDTPWVAAGYEVVLVPGVGTVNIGTLLPTPSPGTTATVLLSYLPQLPFPSGVVSLHTAGVAADPQLDVRQLGAEPWRALVVIRPGDALYASSSVEVRVSVDCLVQMNAGAWMCPACRTINPAGRLECTGCRGPKEGSAPAGTSVGLPDR